MHGSLPRYAQALDAYHRAFERDLSGIIATLDVPAGGLIVDLACGDGAYMKLLADAHPRSRIAGVDISAGYLKTASFTALPRVAYLRGDAFNLPFADSSVDFVWCAQSLYTLQDPEEIFREAHRVLKRPGRFAVLENDSLHYLLIPWPVDLEIALLHAEYEALRELDGDSRRFYVARRLKRLCSRTGLRAESVKVYACTREPPFTPDETAYLHWYFDQLRERTEGRLSSRQLERFIALTDSSSPEYLLNSPDTVITIIDHLLLARKT